jgi:signal peptidase II
MKKLAFLLAATIFLADQASKYYILTLMTDENSYPIDVFSFFRIVLVYNPGVSFGLFNQMAHGQLILTLLSSTITLAVCYWLFTAHEKGIILALSLIIGGAIGNIADRIRLGHVIDFLDFYIGNYHWPAFNIADSAICIGVVYLCIEQFFFHHKDKTHEKTL